MDSNDNSMVRRNWKATYRTAVWSHIQCLLIKSMIHKTSSSENVPLRFGLFKTAATLKGKKKLPSLLPLCSLRLKLTSVERARIPSLVSIYHPADSQEHISEKPGNRSHTEDYLDRISPGFLFPSCFLGHTGRLQRPFRRVISYVKLASWVDSCISDSLLPLHLLRSGPSRLIKSQVLAHQWHDCLGLQI